MTSEADPAPEPALAAGESPEAALRHAAALDAEGRAEEAVAAYRRAIAQWPESAVLHAGLGNLLLRLERAEEALPVLRHAAALHPDAVIHCHVGLALLELGEPAEAAAALHDALRLRPQFPEALSSLAEALRRAGRLDQARHAAERAVAVDFGRFEAHLHLGNVLGDLGEFAAAANAYRRALGLTPGDPAALSNLGIALYSLGRLPEALAQHRAAVAMRPDSAGFRYNMAVALLAAGEFAEGWAAYEARLGLGVGQLGFDGGDGRLTSEVGGPRWGGEPLGGRTIFLYGEQGLGDTLQFARYAPLVGARGGRVVLGVPGPLVRLLGRMAGVAETVPTGARLPAFDVHCPLLSLPLVFGTTVASIPAAIPYLAPDPADVEVWRARLPDGAARLVGLVWAGNPRPELPWAACLDRRRSIALSQLAPLAAVPGIRFVSLQMGPPAAQLADAPPGWAIVDPMERVADFADTAALLAHLDLVVSVDTSVAHLAGALGKPVWLLSRHDACWRWLRERNDSPWYPTMRLYRQPRPGDWDSVIAQTADDLRDWAAGARRC